MCLRIFSEKSCGFINFLYIYIMNKKVKDIAKKMSRLDSQEFNELSTVLMNEHDMSATIYRFKPMSENTNCDLLLMGTGNRKLFLIKSVKEIFGLGLKDAKDIIDSAPCKLKEYMDIDEAEKIKEQLEEFGATLEINYHEN